jgi:hypothetical protein
LVDAQAIYARSNCSFAIPVMRECDPQQVISTIFATYYATGWAVSVQVPFFWNVNNQTGDCNGASSQGSFVDNRGVTTTYNASFEVTGARDCE